MVLNRIIIKTARTAYNDYIITAGIFVFKAKSLSQSQAYISMKFGIRPWSIFFRLFKRRIFVKGGKLCMFLCLGQTILFMKVELSFGLLILLLARPAY